jgi:glycine cleavage system P protein (glycine dehydrogenase) subunit 1
MSQDRPIVHPYIPNSVPSVKQEMLRAVEARTTDDLYESIPRPLRLDRIMNLPPPLPAERDLERHVQGLLERNRSCADHLNFMGAGCWQHYVPAVCDEIAGRSEFLTAYEGETYEDKGRWQATFEFASMMGELLEMDVVNVPTYDVLQAAATALRMASRLNGRREALVASTVSPALLSKMRDYCRPHLEIRTLAHDARSGAVDLDALAAALSERTAAVYFENPSFLGFLETRGDEIARLAHQRGAECVVGVDPLSLGVLAPPAAYGADIVCGEIQSLGLHMSYGGAHGGFIATRDEEKYVMQYPSRLIGIVPTQVEGERGFGDVAFERTSFAVREQGREWVGTASALWAITAGVYMALLGPQGFVDLGEGIMQRARYAARRLARLPGVRCPVFTAPFFKEFTVNFDDTGQTVAQINTALRERRIFGGVDLSRELPALGQTALYCVTEIHTQADIDRLADALQEVIR